VSRNLLVSSFGISTDPAVEDVVPRRPRPDEKEGLFLITKGPLPDDKGENEIPSVMDLS